MGLTPPKVVFVDSFFPRLVCDKNINTVEYLYV